LPQVPQFALSVCVSTHAPPHDLVPVGHDVAVVHAPPMHSRPPVQFVPHAPQLFGSVLRSTHPPPKPPHAVVPGRQEQMPEPLQY